MSHLAIDISEAVATVTISNPPRGYLNGAVLGELLEAVDRLVADDQVRVLMFTGGVPGIFIRHFDVGEILGAARSLRANGVPKDLDNAEPGVFSRLLAALEASPKPTIAAINGLCMGGGFEFSLACDLRLAGPGDYFIGLPEVNVAIFPGAGGTQRLPRVVGPAAALELILRGRVVPPGEAARIGLVHHYFPNHFEASARAIALELAALTPRALADAKAMVRTAMERPLAEGIAEESRRFAALIAEEPEALRLMEEFVERDEAEGPLDPTPSGQFQW